MKLSASTQFTLIRLVPFIVMVAVIMGASPLLGLDKIPTVILGLVCALASRLLLMRLFGQGDQS